MLTKPFHFFWIIKALKVGALALWVLLASFFITVLVYYSKIQRFENQEQTREHNQATLTDLTQLQWLALKEEKPAFFAADVRQELVYLGKNSRPDANNLQMNYLVGLKGSSETASVELGQKIYLEYDHNKLKISPEKGPLWVHFDKATEDQLFYHVGVFIGAYEEEREGVLDLTLDSNQGLDLEYCELMDLGKWWRPDLLYETYGGEGFSYLKGCYRLELPTADSEAPSEMLFVKPQMRLIFQEGMWVICEKESQGYPLAEITNITSSHMDIRVWDESGLYSHKISLPPERSDIIRGIKIEEAFSQIRQRSLHQVSCKVGGRHLVLKEGDWLLHTGLQWKVLRTPDEIEKYLSYQLQGELFVFEEIEKNQGNTVFKGRLFDTMRQHVQTVKVPIATAKRAMKREKRGQGASHIEMQPSHAEASRQDEELLRLANTKKHHEFSK